MSDEPKSDDGIIRAVPPADDPSWVVEGDDVEEVEITTDDDTDEEDEVNVSGGVDVEEAGDPVGEDDGGDRPD